jgi:uncharacterized coiled-coil DUF342 family protein
VIIEQAYNEITKAALFDHLTIASEEKRVKHFQSLQGKLDLIKEAEATLSEDLKLLDMDISDIKQKAEASLTEKIQSMIEDTKKLIIRLEQEGGLSDGNVRDFRTNYIHLQTMQVHFKLN